MTARHPARFCAVGILLLFGGGLPPAFAQQSPPNLMGEAKKHFIDLGCWIAQAGLVKTTPWRDNAFDGDGTFFEDLLGKSTNVLHLPRPLFVHN